MTRIELKTTAIQDVRALCVKNKWYTLGTNAEYRLLFEMVANGAAIMDLANDIYDHSTRASCPHVGTAYKPISDLAKIWREQFKVDDAQTTQPDAVLPNK